MVAEHRAQDQELGTALRAEAEMSERVELEMATEHDLAKDVARLRDAASLEQVASEQKIHTIEASSEVMIERARAEARDRSDAELCEMNAAKRTSTLLGRAQAKLLELHPPGICYNKK